MSKDLYCSMIHGGLNLDFKSNNPLAHHCCLRQGLFPVDASKNFWNDAKFQALRQINIQNKWDPGCGNCKSLEDTGQVSFRIGMNEGLKTYKQTDLSGPHRIDLMFGISCNLACRTCGPDSSTYWQKHLKDNNLWNKPIDINGYKNQAIDALSKLDLSNLRMLVFCGGETLLGQEYWDVTEWLANNVPNAKEQLTVCFQTNGTQPVLEKNYKTIDKLFLVKLHISLDAVEKQFEYLRWPASWDQVAENMFELRAKLPSNVMFLIEETISIFNLLYTDRLERWVFDNFTTNREGDVVNHTRHLANGIFGLQNLSNEYIKAMANSNYKNLISITQENPDTIKTMLQEIEKFDQLRGQSFSNTFPEIAEYYVSLK